MGLFDHLFKNKLPQGDEKMDEVRQTPSLDGTAGAPASSQPDHTVFLHPKAYVPRGGAAPVHPGARPVGQGGGRPSERKTPQPAPPAGGEIVLTLGDVLSRIPTQLLNSGPHDARRELRFKIGDLSSDIARGRAVVSLSRIAALCPDIFQKELTVAEDMEVRLPLQKLVEQIGLMRSNPPTPIPEKMARPVPSETPPGLLPTRAPLAMRTPAAVPRQASQPKADAPNPLEHKPRAVSPPIAPPEISKALQENILKAQAMPLRRTPAESRPGVPPKQESGSPDPKGEVTLKKQSEPAAAKSGVVIPFPAIAAKAETGPPKPEEENADHGAERALEEKLRQLLVEKAASEGSLKAELTAPSHLVTALAEIALQQSLLKTLEARESRAPDVSLAQPASLEASQEFIAKSQLLGLLRRKLEAGIEPAELADRGRHKAEDIQALQASEATETVRRVIPVKAELKAPENRAAETLQESPKPPLASELVEINVCGLAPTAALPEVVEGKNIVPKGPESSAPETRTAETFEDKREENATPGRLEVSVPEANAISAPRAEIAHPEFAPAEAKLDKSGVSAGYAFDAALKDLPKPESPIPTVLKDGLSTTLPVESPHAEDLSKAADSKKPEINASEPFVSTPKTAVSAALVSGLVSNLESISPPKAEIAQTEIPLKETEPRKAQIKEAGAADAALRDLVKPELSKEAAVSMAATPVGLPVELLRAETVSKAAEPKKPEISVAHVFEDTRKTAAAPALVEGLASISQPKAEIAHTEIAPKETAPGKTEVKVAKADAAELEKLAVLKPPSEPVPKTGVSAGIPTELPRPETVSKAAEQTPPEISAAHVFEDTVKTTVAAELVKGLVSNVDLISPPKAEITQTEVTLNETKPTVADGMKGEADEAVLKELAKPKLPTEPISKAGPPPGLPASLPHLKAASEKADPKIPEISAAEAFENPLKATVAPALVQGIASHAESISPPRAEIARTEVALTEADAKNSPAGQVATSEDTPNQSTPPKLPDGSESKSEAVASLPTEAPPTEISPPPAELKKSEVSPAGHFEDSMKKSAAPQLSDARESHPKPAPHSQAEIARADIAPQEQESKEPEPDAATARAETLKQSDNGSPFQTEPAALSTPEPLDSPIAPRESIPREPEGRMLAASVPDAPDAANQQIKTLAISAPAEIEPIDAPQAVMAEVQASLLLSQPRVPVSDGPAVAPRPDQSISALLVSLAALKEAAPETSANSALQMDEDGPPHSKDTVWLSLPPILKYCPREIIAGKLPRMDGKIGIELPLSLIESQVASGLVEISSLRFIAALPPEYMQYFVVREDVKVPIPLAEILRSQQSDLASARAEFGDTARKSERTTSEPGSPVVAAAEPLAPHAASVLGHAEAEASATELPTAMALSQDPVFGVEPAPQGVSMEHPLAPDPAPEPIKPPLVLNIPAFRVFAPPPLQVNASIVNAPANPVPLAWMGHVSIQTHRGAEPRQDEDVPLHSSAPPADSALKPEAPAKSPSPDTGALPTAALSPRFEQEAPEVSANPNKSNDPATLPQPTADSARPVETLGVADVPLALPETPEPQSAKADPAPSHDHSALLRPPVVRPVSIPPPRILTFTPALDPQTSASSSVESAPAESSGPVGKEKLPIPPAFFPASEGSSGIGTAAESQGEEAAETTSPKQATAASDPAAAAPDSSKAAPRITRKSVREKTPVPAPPKIPFSVPNLPDLHPPHAPHIPPVPKAEMETPAPELNPVPPPLPLARFDQDALQRLFMTDEFLDLAAICRHVSALPGLQACVISRPDENVRAGEIPEGFEFSELLAFAPGVTQVAGRLPIGSLKHFTLYAETHSVSFFERHEVCLCVVHRARSFVPGVREKLVTIADELSR